MLNRPRFRISREASAAYEGVSASASDLLGLSLVEEHLRLGQARAARLLREVAALESDAPDKLDSQDVGELHQPIRPAPSSGSA